MIVEEKYGLNKAARLAAKRQTAAKAKEKVVLKLDPDFPFDPIPFDFSFFRAEPSEADLIVNRRPLRNLSDVVRLVRLIPDTPTRLGRETGRNECDEGQRRCQ